MKKVVTAAAASCFALTLLFKCSEIMLSVEGLESTGVYLSVEQTRALFGDDISCTYRDSINYSEHDSEFHYFGAFIDDSAEVHDYVVYVSDFENNPAINSSYPWVCHLELSVDLSYLKEFYFNVGFRVNESSWNWPTDLYNKNKIVYYTDWDTGVYHDRSDYCTAQNLGSGYYRVSTRKLTAVSSYEQWNFTNIPISLASEDFFGIAFSDGEYPDNYGIFQDYSANSYNGQFYLCIMCPFLTDGYHNNTDDSSSDSGSGSGIDYSGTLDDILDKLDEIATRQGILGQTFNEQLNDIYMENQHQNSKLDQVNSNLNKIDSHIQALQIPDLTSQISGDMSHVAQNESKNNSDLRAADANQQIINSVAGYGDVSLPSLDNVHSMPDDFSELWNYTDQDGLSWVNPILYAMPILTLTVGALAYIVFGRAR